MSKYTIDMLSLCEFYAGFNGEYGALDGANYKDYKEIIKTARAKIFDFDYPIFDEAYRVPLETKFLNTFLFREIAFPEVARWKHRLMQKFNEELPYYNQLYASELLKFDPFTDVDMKKDYTLKEKGSRDKNNTVTHDNTHKDRETVSANDTNKLSGTDSTSGTANSTSKDKYSDTPQGGLEGLENDTYMTDARIVTDNDSSSTHTTYGKKEEKTKNGTIEKTITDKSVTANTGKDILDNLNEYVEHIVGHNGGTSHSKMLTDFRETFLNIDKMFLETCKDLFINLY